MINKTLYRSMSWYDNNTDFETISCEWIKENTEKWTPWINNEYAWADEFSLQAILGICTGVIFFIMGSAYVLWKLNCCGAAEAVLFDLVLMNIGKTWLALFDLMTDM